MLNNHKMLKNSFSRLMVFYFPSYILTRLYMQHDHFENVKA